MAPTKNYLWCQRVSNPTYCICPFTLQLLCKPKIHQLQMSWSVKYKNVCRNTSINNGLLKCTNKYQYACQGKHHNILWINTINEFEYIMFYSIKKSKTVITWWSSSRATITEAAKNFADVSFSGVWSIEASEQQRQQFSNIPRYDWSAQVDRTSGTQVDLLKLFIRSFSSKTCISLWRSCTLLI